MAYAYQIIPEIGLLCERWDGRFDADGLWEAVRPCRSHPDYKPGLDVLADFTRAELDLSYQTMLSTIEWTRGDRDLDTGRNAFVVAEPLQMGMARMYETLTHESNVWDDLRIFSSFEEARGWLGVPPESDLSFFSGGSERPK